MSGNLLDEHDLPLVASAVRTFDNPVIQFRDAMREAGVEPPPQLICDGTLHRFRIGGSSDKSGYYVAHLDGIPALYFGDFRTGVEVRFRAQSDTRHTYGDELAHQARIKAAIAARNAEKAIKNEAAAQSVQIIWDEASPAGPAHPYLIRKGVLPHNLRQIQSGALIVPIYSIDGELRSLQYISADGSKKFHPGGAVAGNFCVIGNGRPVYIAEGYATAATIHQVTGQPVAVACFASNLVEVSKHWPGLTVVADHDLAGQGQKYAAMTGLPVILPPTPGQDANDYWLAGGDLGTLLRPVKNWLVSGKEFSSQPAPVRWLVKNWLQANAFIMVHGESGGGKTFVVLNWALHIASDLENWAGNRVRGGPVAYLAGEGWNGLKSRIAAWRAWHQVDDPALWISASGCDLNTPAGYSFALTEIKAMPEKPVLIVVDTLSSFFVGDENSAEDAGVMIKACHALMAEFECSVMLVHHTGLSPEAQHRGSGSGAWKRFLENEISVIKSKDGQPIELKARKMRDSDNPDSVFLDLEKVVVPGWLDEDDQPVMSAVAMVVDGGSGGGHTGGKLTRLDAELGMLKQAWADGGGEIDHEGRPFICRSGLRDFIIQKRGVKPAKAEKMINPAASGGNGGEFIFYLLNASIITPEGYGWSIIDPATTSALLLRPDG